MLRVVFALTLVATLPALAADDALRDRVGELMRQRQWAEAQALLEEVTVREPDNAEAWHTLGLTRLARQDAEPAVVAFEKAVQLAPTNSGYQLQLGHAHGLAATKGGLFAKMGHARKCKAAYERAVALDPVSINARWSLMEFCRQAPGIVGGGLELAYAQADEIARLDARRGRAARASLLAAEKKYDQAFALYDEALREQPGDPDALFHLGRLAAQSGQQLDRGLAALRELATHPDRRADARIHTFIGNILERLGDKPGAVAAYEAAVAGNPNFTRALEALRRLREG
jgi:tetratricopeptide (TPR) repeat protein